MKTRIKKFIMVGAGIWIVCSLCLASLVITAFGGESQSISSRADLAVIQDITFSHQGKTEVIEVTSDRPLVYSYYRLNGPLRAVVDLAQTDPGAFTTPLSFKADTVKQVSLVKHELASGMLTRLEIALSTGADFSVKLNAGDKRKLLITVTSSSKSPAFESSTSSMPAKTPVAQQPSQSPEQVATESAPTPKSKIGTLAPTAPQLASAEAFARKLTDITVTPEGIDIVTDAPLKTYNSFSMTNPERFVVDLPKVRNGITSSKVAIEAFGIDYARLGEHEGKSRIVFEGKAASFKRATLTKTPRGLRFLPTAPAAEAGKQRATESATQSKKKEESQESKVESIDFNMVETGSRLSIKVAGECVAGKPHRNSDGLTFQIKNCVLPRNLQRSVDTSAFPSVVQSVIPYQVTVKGVPETRVLVKLNQSVDYSLRQDGGSIVLDITHPKQEMRTVPGGVTTQVVPGVASIAPRTGDEVVTTQATELAPVTPQSQTVSPQEITAKKLQESAQTASSTKKIYTGRRVTLEFVDADVRKIFQLIAEVSNLNILISDDVSGTITIKLVNVPWDQALDMILETKNLGMKADGNIVLIKPKGKFKSADEELLEAKKTREKMMELQTRVFDVNYAQTADVVSQFKSLSSGRSDSSITPDERTNKVIVTDIEPAIARMKKFLESIDIPEQQVLIEARIVEASSGFTRELGVQWGIHYRDGSASFLGINRLDSGFGGVVSQPPLIGTSGPGMATGISFGTLTSNIQVDLRLSAAAATEQIKIISTPKIATLNNKPAKITQGQSIPYQNTTANTGAVTQFVEAALSLEVTPHVTPDGSVMMKIKASNNSAGATPAGGGPPPINKKEATTEMLVKSGETTVIGGIYVDNDVEGNSGVPFLMDIPWIGWLFKSNSKTKTKNELLIFITPRIIS